MDFESNDSLNTFIDELREQSHLTNNEIKTQIKQKIKKEIIMTKKRKHNMVDDVNTKIKVSSRTLSRYLDKYNI